MNYIVFSPRGHDNKTQCDFCGDGLSSTSLNAATKRMLWFTYCNGCLPRKGTLPNRACVSCGVQYRHPARATDQPNNYTQCADCLKHGYIEGNRPVHLYRMYDVDRRLLYIGKTHNLFTRFASGISSHKKAKSWYGDIHAVLYDTYPSDLDACVAEARAIRKERPLHNKATPIIDLPKIARPLSTGLDYSHVLHY